VVVIDGVVISEGGGKEGVLQAVSADGLLAVYPNGDD